MRRSTGAIFRETRPETIITSACRGEARNASAPNLAMSLRELTTFIISMAQQAKPNVAGHSEDFRAQLINESRLVVRISGNESPRTFSKPIKLRRFPNLPFGGLQHFGFRFRFAPGRLAPVKSALLNHINQSGREQRDEYDHFK